MARSGASNSNRREIIASVSLLSRYVLREHVRPLLFALSAFTGLMLLNQVARQLGNLVGKGLPWGVIAEVFGLSIPFIVATTLPMAVLVGALHAFGRLAADNEITAMKAGGVNLRRLLLPVLAASAIVALLAFAFTDQVLPRSNHRLKTLLVDIARKKPTFELKEQRVNEVMPGTFFLRASRIDQVADRLRDVVIYDFTRDERRRTIYADSGYMRFSAGRTDLYLTLFNGYVHEYEPARPGAFQRATYLTDFVRVRGISNRLERTEEDSFKSDREMTICEMQREMADGRAELARAEREVARLKENDVRALLAVPPAPAPAPPPPPSRPAASGQRPSAYCRFLAAISSWLRPRAAEAQAIPSPPPPPPPSPQLPPQAALPRLMRVPDPTGARLGERLATIALRERAARQRIARFAVEVHKKLALPAACIVFVLIGAGAALHFPRAGIGMVIGVSCAVFGVYYVGLIGGETLADNLTISPFWAMWAPDVIFGAAGLLLLARMGREPLGGRALSPGLITGAWQRRWRAIRRRWARRPPAAGAAGAAGGGGARGSGEPRGGAP